MATKFDSKEYAKQRLLNLCVKYFPKDHFKISAGRKGFRLGESTITLINQSKTILNRFKESEIIIPASTVNVFRYGTLCQEIFENLSNYQIISQIKSRSRRGHRKDIDVIDFDLKKIELEFKKSSNPPVRSQKDMKFIHNVQKFYLKLINDDKYHVILEDVIKKQELFIVDNSDGKKFFDSLFRLLNALMRKNTEKIEIEALSEQKRNEIAKIRAVIAELKEELPHNKHIIELQRERSGIPKIIGEKEQLFSDSDLSLFLKVLTTSLERYMKMIERRENRSIEQKEEFLGLVLEPTRFQGLNEELWRQVVFIIETHGFELLNGKNWFKFEDPTELRQFMVRKDILEKFAHLRKLEKELDEIEKQMQQDPQYSKAQKMIQDFDDKELLIAKLKKEIPEMHGKSSSLSQEIEADKEKVLAFLH
ncbi:MAG: hypothetical protein ACXADY_08890 [Candidatus Hodarchaeales archaeon]|jgi:hypothetical protein